MESIYAAVVLSRGGTWKPRPDEHPYLIPQKDRLKAYPDGATVECKFYGTNGLEIATVDGSVFADRIEFLGDAEEMDRVPAGAGFTIILDTSDGQFPIRHGKVIRKQLEFTTPLAQLDIPPLSIADNLQRSALGSKYKLLHGRLQLNDNSDAGLPIGLGAKSKDGSVRYIQEFTTPGIEIGVTLLNRTPNVASWMSINFGADINFEMGFGVKFETGSSPNRRIHIGTLNKPMDIIDRVPTVSNEVVNNEYYRIRFIPGSKLVTVYKGESLEPIAKWVDENNIVPRGIGYRHLGASFFRSSTTSTKGVQLTSLNARDAA